MSKIVATLTDSGSVTGFKYIYDEGESYLTTAKLIECFVDSDIPLYFGDEKTTVNDYLGESICFTARYY